MSAALSVWLYGTRVADLAENGDKLRWSWTSEALSRWGLNSRVVSHLLPITRADASPARVRVFLDGLLPEGNARVNWAIDAGLAPEDTFAMVGVYGRDTAGALIFQDASEPPPSEQRGSYAPISDAEIGHLLREAERHSPAGARGPQSTSLAGMIPKIGLHRDASGWRRCLDGAASTWILKVAHPVGTVAEDVVDTEAYTLAVARELDLTTVQAHVLTFDGQRAIAVSRYDRVLADAAPVGRIHQEDVAQALGINTSDPTRKYQFGGRLPSLAAVAEVLRTGGAEPGQLLRLVTFSTAVGNTDLHAKNISVLHHIDGSAQLAPAYDIAMHLHHRSPAPRSGFDIAGRNNLDGTAPPAVDVAALIAEGRSWRLPRAEQVVLDTLEALAGAFERVDRSAHPGVSDEAVDLVTGRVRALLNGHAAAQPATNAVTTPVEPVPARRRGPRRRG